MARNAAPRPEFGGPAAALGFLLYDLGLFCGVLLALPWLAFKVATQRRYRDGLLQRAALRLPPRRDARRRIWLHAASAGEMVAVLALRERLLRRNHDLEVVISSTTTSGVAVAAQAGVEPAPFVLPFDGSPCVARALDRIDPVAIVLVELELWPNLVRHAARRGVAIGVANGRVSERTARRWRWPLVRDLVGVDRVRCFAVQRDEYRERLLALAVPRERVFVTGNLKIDRPPQDFAAARVSWRARLGAGVGTRTIVAGSTHPGEAAMIARAARALESEGRNIRLVIAPRHREKLEIAEREIEAAGYRPRRWSELRDSADAPSGGEAVVIDTMGELAAAYAAADVAFVGGTLVDGIGGHNVFEPALAGAPAVVGPHLANVRGDAAFLESGGALAVAANETELRAALGAALAEAGGRMRAAAEAAVAQARGAADRTCDVIEDCLLREPTR